ncbi:MAG: hypothetical protein ACOYJ1_04390 [Peptococcales bacterium]
MSEKNKSDATIDTGCLAAKEVANKIGYDLKCEGEKDVKKTVDPNCEKAQKVAATYGLTVDCTVEVEEE